MKWINYLLGIILIFVVKLSLATCVRVANVNLLSSSAISAGYTAKSWTGSCDSCSATSIGLPAITSLSNTLFQPSGTLLASSTINFVTQGLSTSYTANQILFRCQVADKDSLYEMYATNGDYIWAGMHDITSEVDGAYYSEVKNVAVRLTNTKTGKYYSRYWQSRQLTADDYYSDGTYIYIPASAFSDTILELFKITSTSYFYSSSSANIYTPVLTQPNGYTAFKGPGLATNSLVDGADSYSNYYGFYNLWPAAWGIRSVTKFVRGAMCKVNDYPNLVTLPTITVAELASGSMSQSDFSVSIECESGAVSSTATSTTKSANVSMGFLVNQATAVSAAQSLGLTTSGGGLTWLLDNNYGNSSSASGVGIRIYSSSGNAINLLPDLTSMGTGNIRGWYAFKDLTSLVSSGSTDIYTGDFTASLEHINGQAITVGSVNAQLQVVVSFQ